MKLISDDDVIAALSESHRKLCDKNQRRSLMDLKPLGSKYQRYQLASNNPITEACREMVYNMSPYFFISLTLMSMVNESHMQVLINKFIHKFNQKLFSRKYDKKPVFMEGFAFFEKFCSGVSNNNYHVHMLICENDEYYGKDFDVHKVNFYEAASQVKNERGNRVFSPKAIDIRLAGDERRIDYSFEQLHDGNLDRFKTIGLNGLSDRLYDGF